MNGLMQQQPLLISNLLVHAERHHGDQQIVSRRVEGDIHRTTYRELAARARRMANALAARGIASGDRVATLAWNGYRHMELYMKLFNTTVDGVDAEIGTHLCFGNYAGRPVAKRTYRPLFPYILDMKVDQFALEFANREMAEIDLWQEFPNDKQLAAGLVDVKNYYVEKPEDVAERIRIALRYVPADKLWVVPDCGFSQTARWAAKAKLKAMTEGAAIVRRELTGR